jgi:hypothetical protein
MTPKVKTALIVTGALMAGGAIGSTGSTPADATPQLPPGFHWRYVDHRIADCDGHNRRGKRTVIIWRGNGDMQSAIVCGDGTFWPS